MKKIENPASVCILFYTKDAMTILRYTSLDLTAAGSLWMEAWATPADLGTFDLNGWWYDRL